MILCTFPLPPDSLRVNRRQGHHWGPDNREKTAYALECKKAIREQLMGIEGLTIKRCAMTLTVYLGKGQKCDPSDAGAWAKTAIDALVKERIIVDDNGSCIRHFSVTVERDWRAPRLLIGLQPL